ncbi:hypothetical protein ACLOJK_016780 [Asimina triloba]
MRLVYEFEETQDRKHLESRVISVDWPKIQALDLSADASKDPPGCSSRTPLASKPLPMDDEATS